MHLVLRYFELVSAAHCWIRIAAPLKSAPVFPPCATRVGTGGVCAGLQVYGCGSVHPAATSCGLARGADAALARYLVCLQSIGQVGVWLTKPEVCLCPVMAEDMGRVPKQHLPQRLWMERCWVQLLQDPQPRSKTLGTHP